MTGALEPGVLGLEFLQTLGLVDAEAAVLLALACDALETTDTPIADIAAQLGFSAAANFSRFFMSNTGETPRLSSAAAARSNRKAVEAGGRDQAGPRRASR